MATNGRFVARSQRSSRGAAVGRPKPVSWPPGPPNPNLEAGQISPASAVKQLAVCIRYDLFGTAQNFWIERPDEMTARDVELSAQDRLAELPDRDEPNLLIRTN